MDYMIGMDLGTTSTKAVLYDMDCNVLGYANKLYPLYQDQPDMAEEDPEEIFDAVVDALTEVLRKADLKNGKLQGVSFSAAMHSLIALDADHKPTTRVITWADNRAEKYANEYKQNGKGFEIYSRTGTPTHPMSPLYKLIWLRNEHKDIFDNSKYWVGIKEYIFYRLFGVLKEEISIASATSLFNIFKLDWDEGALKEAGITRDQLPELVQPTEQVTGMHEEYAKVIGIPTDTPFIMGASDGTLSNLGVNAIDPGVVAVTIGTSGAVRTVVDKPVIDPKGRVFCYALTKDRWVIGGPVNNGGIVFRWVRDQLFAPEKITASMMNVDSYDMLTQIAGEVPAGSDGLIFHPYLGGERAPIWDANARGSFFGLTRNHTRAHMVRAALEGIVYNLYNVMLALAEVSGSPKEIMATGGFARSELWRQMLADIFESPVTIPTAFESGALAAVTIAKKSLGLIDDISVIKDYIGETHTYQPNKENYAAYRELVPIFIRLSRQLQTEYANIADFQRKFSANSTKD